VPGPTDLLDAAECARILRCPERTIYALVKLGYLESQNSGDDSCRIAVSELRRFLRDAENRTASSVRSCQSR
jgi:hypothetical protein